MRIVVMVMLAAHIARTGAQAQTPSPTAIVRAYFDAITIQNWEAAATLLRSEDIERIRRESIASFRPQEIQPRTAEYFLRQDSTMPRAVAEYEAARFNRAIASLPDISGLQSEFADVKDTAQLAALSVVQAGARWIEARDMRYHMRRMLSASPDCPKEAYSAAAASAIPRFDIIGEVIRGDSAWVLYRNLAFMSDGADEFVPRPSIATLFREARGWRIKPLDDYGSVQFSVVECQPSSRPQ